MIDSSPTLAIPPDRPVDPLLLDILRRVDRAARDLGIDYFVAGALARDLVLLHAFGKDTGRATRDVDLGLHIDTWDALDLLKARLLQEGGFTEQTRLAHRLIYRMGEEDLGTPLDLLPFGGVEQPDATIAWPPGMDIIMNVAGFAEARHSALSVEIETGFAVPVACLPSLAVLKLIAWRDRHLETTKDATDFLLIARHYAEAGNLDRLYETESALLEANGFDPELAGATLLGKDAASVCSAAAAQGVRDVQTDPRLRQRLIDQLLRVSRAFGGGVRGVGAERYVDAFYAGFGAI